MQFTFSQRGMFFDPAGLYHYAGDAVYPALASQLVANLDTLPNTTQIVSNSLPAWLQIVDYSPIWLLPPNPGIQLYPSFLVPSDLQPPYGAVHIEPSATYAYQAQPNFSATMSHYQLAYDRVRITLYGTTNDQAASFLDVVNQYSLDTDLIGMVGMPLIRDEKRGQVELQALAMKKTIEFEVSYLQTSMRNLARQLIKQATVAFTVSPFPT
ncbi:MAG: hypothetical protein B7X10_00950 [Burkholderiales bacterium 21-58-4]|nr:MAG: hypothetical protein B7X10_00950 [Burkholderiales bacterium 21-58-4]